MRLAAALVLVLLLAGCSQPSNDRPSADDLTDLRAQIAELRGVDHSEVDDVVYSYERGTEIDVEITTSDVTGVAALVTAATELIDGAPLDDYSRELRVTIADSSLSVSAGSHATFDPAERAETFVRWVTDPRVATITWGWQLELQLVGDDTTDGSLVETVYSELADATTLADGGLSITDPGSYSVATAQNPYSESRFGAAREIAALDGVSDCSFRLETSSDGSYIHSIFCAVAGDAESTGTQINALLEARGLLESADVHLQAPDGSITTHDGSYVFDEG